MQQQLAAQLFAILGKFTNVRISLYKAKFRTDQTYSHPGNKKRGVSAMSFSDDLSVDAVVSTVLDKVEVDEDMEDSNVVGEQMMATLYSPAVDKGVVGADGKKTKSVAKEESQVVKALAQALNVPVMRLLGIATYAAYDGDITNWFEIGPFTSLTPDEMEEISLCLARLAKIRRVQDAAVAAI